MRTDQTELDALGAAVARENEPAIEVLVAQARRQRLTSRRHSKRPLAFFSIAVAAAALCVLAVFLAGRSTRAPLTVAIDATPLSAQTWVEATQRPTVLAFSDASTVALQGGALARVEQLSTRGAVVHLARGSLTASIAHHDDTQWRFEVGPYRVKVTGTKFTARWDEAAERFELDLLEGSVEVEGPRVSRRRLATGERLEVQRELPAPVLLEAPPEPPAEALPPGSSPPPVRLLPAKAASKMNGAREPAWLSAIRAGEYQRAARAAELLGVAGLCEKESVDRVMLLGDALRFANRRPDASGCYLAVRRRYSGTPSAALAAFELGVMSAPAGEAGPWFETYLTEAPNGPLAAQALGRLLEGQHTAHDPRAAATAKRYLEAWPDGPHAALARLIAR